MSWRRLVMSDQIMSLNWNEFASGSFWGQKWKQVFLVTLQRWRLIPSKCSVCPSPVACCQLRPWKWFRSAQQLYGTIVDVTKKKVFANVKSYLCISVAECVAHWLNCQGNVWIRTTMWKCAICAKYLVCVEGAATCVCQHLTPTECFLFYCYFL